jgi:hypothetical protein
MFILQRRSFLMPKNTKDTITKNVKIKSSKLLTSSKSSSSKKSSNVRKAVSSKKTTSKKQTTSKKAVSIKSTEKISSKNNNKNILEYYDLPYRYNQTVVKMLAQSPKTLFVYWDISDLDKKSFIKKYGKDFFDNTKPVLIIHNETKNYTFEIDINDFANCWYFNVPDEKCEYLVELGRRPKNNSINIPNNYLFVTSSNEIESPNGHILFEKEQKTLFYRNVKSNETYSKDVANLQFIKHLARTYKIYDLYKSLYKDENLNDVNNPSSSFK